MGFIKCSRLSCWLELTGLERSTVILSESLVWKWIFLLFQTLLDSLKSRAFMTEPFLEECLAFDYSRKISLAPCYIGVCSFLCSRHHGTHLGLLIQNTSWQCTSWHCTSQRTQNCWLDQKHNCGFLCLLHTICHVACQKRSLESLCAMGTKSRFFVSLSWGTCVRSAVVWLRESSWL